MVKLKLLISCEVTPFSIMQEILHEVWGAAIMRLVKDPQVDLDFHHRAQLPLLTKKRK
jgi:hypothetical protein